MSQNYSTTFQKDLKIFYDLLQTQSESINGMYKIFDEGFSDSDCKYLQTLESLCERIGLKPEKEVLMAICERIVNLKEGSIIQVMKKYQKSASEILIARRVLLNFVSDFYAKKHQELLAEVQKRKLFNEFYREILIGVHQIGLMMNQFFESWQNILIDGINKNMQKKYGDEESLKILAPSIDKEEIEGKMICSDRSYSIPKNLGIHLYPFPILLPLISR